MGNRTLVILAAGKGSRFGGFKQIENVDGRGHRIIDYSVYDAVQVGFSRVIFVINPEIELEFRKIADTYSKKYHILVDFAIQNIEKIADGHKADTKRKKPWGTGHAVACLKGLIDSPFALINADDYYGRSALGRIYDFISMVNSSEQNYAMVGYRLENTLSENGRVSRGVCKSEGGYLTEIVEVGGIYREDNRILCEAAEEKSELNPDSMVSVNLWGFTPRIIDECELRFNRFLQENIQNDTENCEFYLPSVVSSLIKEDKATVRVLECDSQWQGITYRGDKIALSDFLLRLTENGEYPINL